MNFLAHAYLSFGHPPVLVGNLISDFVKGQKQYQFPDDIRKGILLHRFIDDYTDTHRATREAKLFFKSHYRLYSAPIVDIVYDHLLASDQEIFPAAALDEFARTAYQVLDDHLPLLPPAFAAMLPYMKRDNWLYNYRTEEGIFKSLQGLMRRASMDDDGQRALALLQTHKAELRALYRQIIPDVKHFAKACFDELVAGDPTLPNN